MQQLRQRLLVLPQPEVSLTSEKVRLQVALVQLDRRAGGEEWGATPRTMELNLNLDERWM